MAPAARSPLRSPRLAGARRPRRGPGRHRPPSCGRRSRRSRSRAPRAASASSSTVALPSDHVVCACRSPLMSASASRSSDCGGAPASRSSGGTHGRPRAREDVLLRCRVRKRRQRREPLVAPGRAQQLRAEALGGAATHLDGTPSAVDRQCRADPAARRRRSRRCSSQPIDRPPVRSDDRDPRRELGAATRIPRRPRRQARRSPTLGRARERFSKRPRPSSAVGVLARESSGPSSRAGRRPPRARQSRQLAQARLDRGRPPRSRSRPSRTNDATATGGTFGSAPPPAGRRARRTCSTRPLRAALQPLERRRRAPRWSARPRSHVPLRRLLRVARSSCRTADNGKRRLPPRLRAGAALAMLGDVLEACTDVGRTIAGHRRSGRRDQGAELGAATIAVSGSAGGRGCRRSTAAGDTRSSSTPICPCVTPPSLHRSGRRRAGAGRGAATGPRTRCRFPIAAFRAAVRRAAAPSAFSSMRPTRSSTSRPRAGRRHRGRLE